MEKKKKESKLNWLNRHYELVANENNFSKPYNTPKKLPENTLSFYHEAEEYNKKTKEKQKPFYSKSILNK
jgi:hypothetical protein